MPSPQAVRIIYGPTGGRYPMMFGVAEALEKILRELGVAIVDRIGISGGALVSAVLSGDETFQDWVRRSCKLTKKLKLFGTKTPFNVYSLLRYGGLFNSTQVMKEVFTHLLIEPPKEPCYAISWCKSANMPVALPMHGSPHASKYVFSSAAVPIVFSPVRIANKHLPESVRTKLEVGLDGFSVFQDGGLSGVFPSELVGDVSIPTIMVFIDPIPVDEDALKNQKPDVWDKLFGLQNKAGLLAVTAKKKDNLQTLVVPQLESFEKYRLRFDMDLEAALDMYDHGRVMAEYSFHLTLFPEDLDAQNQQRQSNARHGLGGEHTLIQVVPSEHGEYQEGQPIPE